jgi:signal transduction histidine kinase
VLHKFLTDNRAELVDRCRAKAAQRLPPASGTDVVHGIPCFLDQLVKTLQVEQTSQPLLSRTVSGPSGGGPAISEIGVTATLHGRELSERGFTIQQVVHDYGDLCQAITDLAHERGESIEVDEFRTLNRCLDNGIADAVTEYVFQRNALAEIHGDAALNEKLGLLAHELRNLLFAASLALKAVRTGHVGLTGATSTVLDRSLIGMRHLIDRTLADVRAAEGISPRMQLTSLAQSVDDATIIAALEAKDRGCTFATNDIDRELTLNVDRDLFSSAVGNLLQNAFKFTQPGTAVSLKAYAVADRIRIDVEDHCGGLPPGALETMFRPFSQSGRDRSGVGLGLTVCRRSVEANNGVLRVSDRPGSGCVFTIDLPRHYG